METIKVNMNPNPLDVQTIHASQNDGEARQWEFELHNNGELIDTSEVTEQMFFKAYKGGTEQILPENGSTPTTSPFKGDIKYPQGLLSDQEFLYRECPTEEDGLAKITDIKGNTLVWNQLIGELDATTTWNDIAITNNGNGSLTLSGTYSGSSTGNMYITTGSVSVKANHVYFLDTSCSTLADQIVRITSSQNFGVLRGGYEFHKPAVNLSGKLDFRVAVGRTYNDTIFPNMFDLTDMFGETVADEILAMETAHTGDGLNYFRSLFPLNYYAYNSGSLLNFNGTGIKTENKDQTDEYTLSLPISTYFPTGMKSKGDVYDELTESKAITRVGSRAYQSGDESDTSVITDGTTTYYALATPTETSFTTASLVTENAEIPLSNEDGILIGKCTEQLSSESGFFDAKIKLSDSDGECYSNKIQLHIERSPQ